MMGATSERRGVRPQPSLMGSFETTTFPDRNAFFHKGQQSVGGHCEDLTPTSLM